MGGSEIQVKWLKAEVISELLGLSHRLSHYSKVIIDRNIEKKSAHTFSVDALYWDRNITPLLTLQ